MKLERILVIADQNDRPQLALRAALDLVRDTSAKITVVGFVHDAFVEESHMTTPNVARRVRTALLRDKRRSLNEALSNLVDIGVRVSAKVVWIKDIASWITKHVRTCACDLIIKSGHRSEHLAYTPTDWRLLREAPVPIMIVRDRVRKRPRRIVAALDLLSEDALQRALDHDVVSCAADLARQLAAELHVVCAVPVSTLARDLDLIDCSALETRARSRIRGRIAELMREFAIPESRVHIKAGPPERVIDGRTSKLKALFLVMGTHGRAGLRGALLGNTAEKVLHRNRSTVLALRPRQPRAGAMRNNRG